VLLAKCIVHKKKISCYNQLITDEVDKFLKVEGKSRQVEDFTLLPIGKQCKILLLSFSDKINMLCNYFRYGMIM
jgi:hypothetical protein